MTRVLAVGLSKKFLSRLEGHLAPGSVVVLEEPDVFVKKTNGELRSQFPVLGEVLLGAYHQADDFLRIGAGAHRRQPFDAVVPVREYGVDAAAALAEDLGLPGATRAAAAVLRDKITLREVTARAGIRNPSWAEIRDPDDIRDFAAGGSVVVKPANRQASVGVQLLDAGDDAEQAWDELVHAEESTQLPDRRMAWRYLAEERLVGQEYSVEALVRDREILFENVTGKTILPGRHPVELAHLVPARGADVPAFGPAMRALVDAIGFRTGILHAEWIVDAAGIALVECAGRAPGDCICDLIDLAYGTHITTSLIALLAGQEPPTLPRRHRRAAAIRFLTTAPGRVVDVQGVEETRRLDGIEELAVSVTAGDVVEPWRSSWNRHGHVIAVGPTPNRAAALAEHAAGRIRIVTSDPALV